MKVYVIQWVDNNRVFPAHGIYRIYLDEVAAMEEVSRLRNGSVYEYALDTIVVHT